MPDFRKFVDKAKEFVGQHPDQADKGMEKAGEAADEKTGGRYSEQIQQGEQRARDYMGTGGQSGGQPGQDQGQYGQDQGGQYGQDRGQGGYGNQ